MPEGWASSLWMLQLFPSSVPVQFRDRGSIHLKHKCGWVPDAFAPWIKEMEHRGAHRKAFSSTNTTRSMRAADNESLTRRGLSTGGSAVMQSARDRSTQNELKPKTLKRIEV